MRSANTTVAQVRGRSVPLAAPHITSIALCKYHCGTGPWQVCGSWCSTYRTASELCKYHCGTGPWQVRASCCNIQGRQYALQIPLWHKSVAGPCYLLPQAGPPVLSSNTTVAQVRGRSVAFAATYKTASVLRKYHCGTGPWQVRATCCSTQDRKCSLQIPLWHRSVAGPCHLLLHTGPPMRSANTTVAQVRSRSVPLPAPHRSASALFEYHCGTGPWQVRACSCHLGSILGRSLWCNSIGLLGPSFGAVICKRKPRANFWAPGVLHLGLLTRAAWKSSFPVCFL